MKQGVARPGMLVLTNPRVGLQRANDSGLVPTVSPLLALIVSVHRRPRIHKWDKLTLVIFNNRFNGLYTVSNFQVEEAL